MYPLQEYRLAFFSPAETPSRHKDGLVSVFQVKGMLEAGGIEVHPIVAFRLASRSPITLHAKRKNQDDRELLESTNGLLLGRSHL